MPIDIDIDEYIEQVKDLKPEDIITPESDKVFFAWVESRFPGILTEVQNRLIEQKLAEKENIEAYLREVGIEAKLIEEEEKKNKEAENTQTTE